MQMRLPKACISCNSFDVKGYKEDKHCPYVEQYTGRPKTRTQFGQCTRYEKLVFCTELCNRHAHEDNIEVFEVTNRPEALEPHQAKMFQVV